MLRTVACAWSFCAFSCIEFRCQSTKPAVSSSQGARCCGQQRDVPAAQPFSRRWLLHSPICACSQVQRSELTSSTSFRRNGLTRSRCRVHDRTRASVVKSSAMNPFGLDPVAITLLLTTPNGAQSVQAVRDVFRDTASCFSMRRGLHNWATSAGENLESATLR